MPKPNEIFRRLRHAGDFLVLVEAWLLNTRPFKYLRRIGNGAVFAKALLDFSEFWKNNKHTLFWLPPQQRSPLSEWMSYQVDAYSQFSSRTHHVVDTLNDSDKPYPVIAALNYFLLYELPLFLLGIPNNIWTTAFFHHIETEFLREEVLQLAIAELGSQFQNQDESVEGFAARLTPEILFDNAWKKRFSAGIDSDPHFTPQMILQFLQQNSEGEFRKALRMHLQNFIQQATDNNEPLLLSIERRKNDHEKMTKRRQQIYKSLKESYASLIEHYNPSSHTWHQKLWYTVAPYINKIWYVFALIAKGVGPYLVFKMFQKEGKGIVKRLQTSTSLANFLQKLSFEGTSFIKLIAKLTTFISVVTKLKKPILALEKYYSLIKASINKNLRSDQPKTDRMWAIFILIGTLRDFFMQSRLWAMLYLYMLPMPGAWKEKLLGWLNRLHILNIELSKPTTVTEIPAQEIAHVASNQMFALSRTLEQEIKEAKHPLLRIKYFRHFLYISQVNARTLQKAIDTYNYPFEHVKRYLKKFLQFLSQLLDKVLPATPDEDANTPPPLPSPDARARNVLHSPDIVGSASNSPDWPSHAVDRVLNPSPEKDKRPSQQQLPALPPAAAAFEVVLHEHSDRSHVAAPPKLGPTQANQMKTIEQALRARLATISQSSDAVSPLNSSANPPQLLSLQRRRSDTDITRRSDTQAALIKMATPQSGQEKKRSHQRETEEKKVTHTSLSPPRRDGSSQSGDQQPKSASSRFIAK